MPTTVPGIGGPPYVPPTFDTSSATGLYVAGGSSGSFSYTAASGADVFVPVLNLTSDAITVSATWDGTDPGFTELGSVLCGGGPNEGDLHILRAAKLGDGNAHTLGVSISAPTTLVAGAISYTGIRSVSTPTTTTSTTASISAGPITLGSHQIALCFCSSKNKLITSSSGGTQEMLVNNTTAPAIMARDSSTSGTTFTFGYNGASNWFGGTVTMILS